jgi:hypothetical protein
VDDKKTKREKNNHRQISRYDPGRIYGGGKARGLVGLD